MITGLRIIQFVSARNLDVATMPEEYRATADYPKPLTYNKDQLYTGTFYIGTPL